jgi:hypothetical protein
MDGLRAGYPGLSRLIEKKVQDVPISEFTRLHENDILFIDSSHVITIGGDVQYEYLEIIPRLEKGVLIHVHDVFFPAEYPKEWVMEKLRFWNEQYILQAFLAFNESFKILFAGSFMHLNYPEKLEKVFAAYNHNVDWPHSLWMRRF